MGKAFWKPCQGDWREALQIVGWSILWFIVVALMIAGGPGLVILAFLAISIVGVVAQSFIGAAVQPYKFITGS